MGLLDLFIYGDIVTHLLMLLTIVLTLCIFHALGD